MMQKTRILCALIEGTDVLTVRPANAAATSRLVNAEGFHSRFVEHLIGE